MRGRATVEQLVQQKITNTIDKITNTAELTNIVE